MKEIEIVDRIPLLDSKGELTQAGFARFELFDYDRSKIKANAFRIKEWDYYMILNPKKAYCICMTFSDLGYAGLFALAFIDYKLKLAKQIDSIKLLTLHKTGLVSSPDKQHTLYFKDKEFSFTFTRLEKERRIVLSAPSLTLPDNSTGLYVDALFEQDKYKESINIATSWKENRKAFYLNEKVIAMRALSGYVKRGITYDDLTLDLSTLILDWGRGRWTRENTWYWLAASGVDNDNNTYGFNLGYGFSDRTPASENGFFLNNRMHKLKEVEFTFSSHMDAWYIKDNEGRLELTLTPVVPRLSKTNLGVIVSDQKQIFGYLSGHVYLDNGDKYLINDLMGFAEEVYNKW